MKLYELIIVGIMIIGTGIILWAIGMHILLR